MMADAKKEGCLVRGGLIVSWILLILIAIGIFTFSIGWGIGFVVIMCFITASIRMDTTSEATAMHESKHIKSTKLADAQYIDQDYFTDVTGEVEKILSIRERLLQDPDFLRFAEEHTSITVNGHKADIREQLTTLFWVDMVRSFVDLGHSLDFESKECFGLLYYFVREKGAQKFGYYGLRILTKDVREQARMLTMQTKRNIERIEGVDTLFYISKFLSVYDADLQHLYLVALYRLTSLTAKADGVVTDTEAAWLSKVLDLSQGTSSQQNSAHQQYTTSQQDYKAAPAEKPQPSFAGVKLRMKKLNDLIGLASVKEEVTTLTNFIKIQQQRQSSGLKTSSVSYHCVFTGNPGTGKTSVARIVADIYRNLGILSKGHLVETDRSGLVAEYVGQTAVKTNKIIKL